MASVEATHKTSPSIGDLLTEIMAIDTLLQEKVWFMNQFNGVWVRRRVAGGA
jgi:hypothetical protein